MYLVTVNELRYKFHIRRIKDIWVGIGNPSIKLQRCMFHYKNHLDCIFYIIYLTWRQLLISNFLYK